MEISKWRDYPEYVVVRRVFNGDPNKWDCIVGFGDIDECKRVILQHQEYGEDAEYIEVFRLSRVSFEAKMTAYIYDSSEEN